MKIYIIQEGCYDRVIRAVTIYPETAEKICKIFAHLGLYFEEYETIEDAPNMIL